MGKGFTINAIAASMRRYYNFRTNVYYSFDVMQILRVSVFFKKGYTDKKKKQKSNGVSFFFFFIQ